MNKPEARKLLIEALDRVVHLLDHSHLSRLLADPEFDPLIEELELDSLGVVDWALQIEEATGLDLDPAQMRRFKRLSEVIDYVAQNRP